MKNQIAAYICKQNFPPEFDSPIVKGGAKVMVYESTIGFGLDVVLYDPKTKKVAGVVTVGEFKMYFTKVKKE